MQKKFLELMGLAAMSLLWLTAAGCSTSAVGDPCVPEQVPEGGFLASETYLETSSVQCATRVCLVRNLDGDPNNLQEEDCPLDVKDDEGNLLEPSTCVSESDVERSVYCSCRCDAPGGSGLPTCGCPGGFICEEVLETGGDGLRGSYCVRDPLLEVDE
jgi:hypothetical protein